MDVSVLICTYNRAALLARTLDSLALSEVSPALRWEVIVVDNNSTDETPAVVRARVAGFPCPLRLVFELSQGKSHALNTGITASAARVIVFTDDDVWAPPAWLAAGVEPLIARRDIEYTGGPVFPMWEVEPPAWIDGDPGLLWGPIALVDYGREPFIFEDRRRIAMGVNMAVCRSLIERVGGFHPALERRGATLMGQGQAEFFFRTRAAGARGLYVPGMWLKHHVPASRLTRSYYRRWWYWKGVARGSMQDLHPLTELGIDLATVPKIAGIPRFMWGSTVRDAGRWLHALAARRTARRVECEMSLAYFVGYARQRLARSPASAAAAGRIPPAHAVSAPAVGAAGVGRNGRVNPRRRD